VSDLEALILGAAEQYTRFEVAERSGLDPQVTLRYWRALGFANVSDDAVAFTEMDVRALRQVRRFVDDLPVTEDEIVRVVRVLGQSTARLAEWFAEEISEWQRRHAADRLEPEAILPVLQRLIKIALPELDDLVVYALRRQLAAVIARVAEDAREAVQANVAVGFADLVSFTRLSRRLEMRELAGLIEAFEAAAADIVAAQSGRLVKTLGDEVLFATDSPDNAAEIGLQLVERLAAHPDMPDLRVGIAYGKVLSRMGDMFGPTVNLASRLTSMASPATIVVDRQLAEALQYNAAYRLSMMRRRPVRGLGLVEASRLRRAR
jgi:adenylate cyclase